MPVEYTEIPPTSEAAPWVECFWWRTGEADGGTLHRVLPDGCVDLLFDVSPDGAEGTRRPRPEADRTWSPRGRGGGDLVGREGRGPAREGDRA